MLVLSRKPGETIRIGDDIYITLVRSTDHVARIGITAPKAVNIARVELLDLPHRVQKILAQQTASQKRGENRAATRPVMPERR